MPVIEKIPAKGSKQIQIDTSYQYQPFMQHNFRDIPQIKALSNERQSDIEIVASVFPFKVNNYVIDQLINWNNVPNDPIFTLTFPQKKMLSADNFRKMSTALQSDDKDTIQLVANKIRMSLNPHPAGQEYNIPHLKDGTKLYGMQHKYDETVLFFPSQGQTCHSYCTFCFRWPQFIGIKELQFATQETDLLIQYLSEHNEVTDVLFTGGDPMIMKTKILSRYIDSLINAKIKNLKTIRIGTKALSYWPYRFLTDNDADELLDLFKRVGESGIHLAFMAHFNHPVELSTQAVAAAIHRIRKTGAQIRTQSPVLANINDDPKIWADMWQRQVSLGCVPYYMFVTRDTGAQDFFGIPLIRAHQIFKDAYQKVSGLARTVRGPIMSANPGKIHVIGTMDFGKKKAILLQFIQGRNPVWVQRPFLARFDEKAIWIDDLKPLSGKKFFFENELEEILESKQSTAAKTEKKIRKRKTPILSSINNVKTRLFEDRIGLYHWKIGGRNFS